MVVSLITLFSLPASETVPVGVENFSFTTLDYLKSIGIQRTKKDERLVEDCKNDRLQKVGQDGGDARRRRQRRRGVSRPFLSKYASRTHWLVPCEAGCAVVPAALRAVCCWWARKAHARHRMS